MTDTKYKKARFFKKKQKSRPQGSIDKTDLRLLTKIKNITIFQKKGRPQGNIDKTDLRLLTKKHPFPGMF